MYLDEKPVVTQLRGYLDPEGYSKRLPYEFIVTIHHIGADEVFLQGLSGTINRPVVESIAKHYKKQGKKVLTYEKNGEIIERKLND